MEIINPFKLQNWKFKKFLIVILFFQISLLGLFVLNNLGIDTPIIRPLVGTIYLMFIPGYILLRILKLHNLDSVESLVYGVGLSLFFDMFVGFMINTFYPFFGITDRPISETPIVLTMILSVGILSIIAYIRDRDYEDPDYIPLEDILKPQPLFLSLLPFMTILGTYLVNYHDNNILLMLLIVIIILISLIVGFTSWIDKKYFPYAIWVIAISLLYHMMLITPYAINHDGEMVGAKNTIEKGYWDPKLYGNYNSIISSKVFTPMISFICNISLTWVYKAVFPLIISIIPLVVYQISRKYLDGKDLFLAGLVFMVSAGLAFVEIFTVITKQAMATLFIGLMFDVIVKKKHNIRLILSTIFGWGIIISHYGSTYLILFALVSTAIGLYIVSKVIDIEKKYLEEFKEFYIITLIYVINAMSWYLYVSDASVITSIVNIATNVYESIWDEFLSPKASRGAYMITKRESGILRTISKYLNFSIIIFIILGVLKYIRECGKRSIDDIVYLSLSLYFLWILVLSVVLPHFATMSPRRLYILGLVTLSLFCVMGAVHLLQIVYGVLRVRRDRIEKDAQKFLSIYLMILILFNTDFIWEVIKDSPSSIALSKKSVNIYGTLEDKANFYSRYIVEYDVYSIKWLSSYAKKYTKVYYTGGYTSIASVPINYGSDSLKYRTIDKDLKSLPKGSYVLLLYVNIRENIGFGVLPGVHWFDWYEFNRSNVYPFIVNCTHKIYTNGGSQVLLVP